MDCLSCPPLDNLNKEEKRALKVRLKKQQQANEKGDLMKLKEIISRLLSP